MKGRDTIFITVGEWFVLRNVLKTSFFSHLRERLPDTHIVFIVEYGKRSIYEPQLVHFGNASIEEASNPKEISFFEKSIAFLARNGLHTGVNEVLQHRAWQEGESRIPPLLKRWFGKVFGRSKAFQHYVRMLEMRVSPHAHTAELFAKYNPTLVFGTTLINSQVDVPILREGLRRGIRTVAMTRSWDNLSGSGFLRIIPDRFFVQNKHLFEMARDVHFVPTEKMVLFGIPHYDFNFDMSLRQSRETFCADLGIDPKKKIVLYAAVGTAVFRKEAEMVEVLSGLIENSSIPNAHCIFRLHPAFPMSVSASPYVTVEMGEQLHAIPRLINSLVHADVVVTVGSSMIIDASVLGTPVVSIAFDGASGPDAYWYSTKCFYDYFPTSVLLHSGAVRVVENKEGLAKEVSAYFLDCSADEEERKKIIERFAEPYDGKAGERLADLVANS